ncbi:tRNA lysidine(34) synthetase TilS [Parasediminibacterium sp. JCM 36343]|uniref:tRNA lysidine(34) synthetase TilS n=1 Tax=Parasediminibacterium sp. JCM 36343 TaxID=3374279 RepID=UPI00397C8DA3
MALLEQFIQFTQQQIQISPKNTHLLLAVSGGIDSMVMVDLFHKAGYSFTIAHCNFQLRGEESTRDEMFVKALGEKYNKEVLVKLFNTKEYATSNKLSIQVAARELRYAWFEELLTVARESFSVNGQQSMVNGQPTPDNLRLTTYDLRLLSTAHHADDNIETLLLNFFRGTGISGLHGILPRQGNIIRPLLFAKREDIVAYAKKNGLAWVEDNSNASDKYSRNFVRHQVMPLMKTIYPQAEENLLGNIERFKEIELIYNTSIVQKKAKLIEPKGNEWHLPILKLKKQVPLKTIVYEVVKDFGFASTQTGEVVKLLDAANGSYMASPTHRLIVNRNWLIIAPIQPEEATNVLIEEGVKEINFKEGLLTLKPSTFNEALLAENKLPIATNIAVLNADDIEFPLLLRPYKQGDYFYPLGMQKKKKLSKFFIDQKLSKTDKEKVWVIESNKRIVWVVGYRIDNRFRLKPSTSKMLEIDWEKV